MLRRNGTGKLGGESDFSRRSDVNPMATVANLVDAMLVLAVGIMLALIISWNLNIGENGKVRDKADKENAISDFTEDDISNTNDPKGDLEKQGSVYYDPATDKYNNIADDGSQMVVDQ